MKLKSNISTIFFKKFTIQKSEHNKKYNFVTIYNFCSKQFSMLSTFNEIQTEAISLRYVHNETDFGKCYLQWMDAKANEVWICALLTWVVGWKG